MKHFRDGFEVKIADWFHILPSKAWKKGFTEEDKLLYVAKIVYLMAYVICY